MFFITTKEQETILDQDYKKKLLEKKKEIKEIEKKTGKIQKFTAKAYIQKDPRIFYKEGENYFIEINNEKIPYVNENINEKKIGCIYKTDSDFDDKILDFLKIHKNIKITFYIHKKDGCIGYFTENHNEIPAKIESLDSNDILILEDKEKYDLICG